MILTLIGSQACRTDVPAALAVSWASWLVTTWCIHPSNSLLHEPLQAWTATPPSKLPPVHADPTHCTLYVTLRYRGSSRQRARAGFHVGKLARPWKEDVLLKLANENAMAHEIQKPVFATHCSRW